MYMPVPTKPLDAEMLYALGHAVQHEETLFGDYKNVTPDAQMQHGNAAAFLIAMLLGGNEAAAGIDEVEIHYWAWTGSHIVANLTVGDEVDWWYIKADCTLGSQELDYVPFPGVVRYDDPASMAAHEAHNPSPSTPADVLEFWEWVFEANQEDLDTAATI